MGLFSKAKKVDAEKVASVTEIFKLGKQLIAQDDSNFFGLMVHALSNDYDPVLFKNSGKILVKFLYCGSSVQRLWQTEEFSRYDVFKETFKMFEEENDALSFCTTISFDDSDDVTAVLNAALQNAGFKSIDEKRTASLKSFYQQLL